MATKSFCAGDIKNAKILVIGHDPRLQVSNTVADFAFFGEYYFKQIPTQTKELRKYKLAAAVYDYISHLTSHSFLAKQIVLTNLCNKALPHAPKGKTVYIPEAEARNGITAIQNILSQSSIEVIFAMSEQVNYWLQKLEFYMGETQFLSSSEPKVRGRSHNPPFYEPTQGRAFTQICGNRYLTGDGRSVVPILHVKQWPLRGPFTKAYGKAYETCINALK